MTVWGRCSFRPGIAPLHCGLQGKQGDAELSDGKPLRLKSTIKIQRHTRFPSMTHTRERIKQEPTPACTRARTPPHHSHPKQAQSDSSGAAASDSRSNRGLVAACREGVGERRTQGGTRRREDTDQRRATRRHPTLVWRRPAAGRQPQAGDVTCCAAGSRSGGSGPRESRGHRWTMGGLRTAAGRLSWLGALGGDACSVNGVTNSRSLGTKGVLDW